MRIRNITVSGNGVNFLRDNNIDVQQLSRSVLEISRIFKCNAAVSLDCISSSKMKSNNSFHPDASAAADSRMIYLFSDKGVFREPDKLILHEYVHVCIANSFRRSCPLWLNEGLAVFLSGQNIMPIRPTDLNQLFVPKQSTPDFYNMSLFTVQRLVDNMTVQGLVDAARGCRSFPESPVFGIKAVEMLCRHDVSEPFTNWPRRQGINENKGTV